MSFRPPRSRSRADGACQLPLGRSSCSRGRREITAGPCLPSRVIQENSANASIAEPKPPPLIESRISAARSAPRISEKSSTLSSKQWFPASSLIFSAAFSMRYYRAPGLICSTSITTYLENEGFRLLEHEGGILRMREPLRKRFPCQVTAQRSPRDFGSSCCR